MTSVVAVAVAVACKIDGYFDTHCRFTSKHVSDKLQFTV